MTPPPHSDSDREIMDTIRLHLLACYTNAEDGREYTREELEETFATDAGLRAWVTDVAGIDPDTLTPETNLGRAMIHVHLLLISAMRPLDLLSATCRTLRGRHPSP